MNLQEQEEEKNIINQKVLKLEEMKIEEQASSERYNPDFQIRNQQAHVQRIMSGRGGPNGLPPRDPRDARLND